MKASSDAINLIKKWEGLRLNAYYDPVGVLTIGYGHTGPDVYPGQAISMDEAEALLLDDVYNVAERPISRLITAPLTQNQYDALVSWTFNLGSGNLQNSTLRRKINANPNDPTIPDEFKKWNKAGGIVLNGLTKRREEEAALWSGSKKKALIHLGVLIAVALFLLFLWTKLAKP